MEEHKHPPVTWACFFMLFSSALVLPASWLLKSEVPSSVISGRAFFSDNITTFTPLGAAVLLFWTLPLVVAGILSAQLRGTAANGERHGDSHGSGHGHGHEHVHSLPIKAPGPRPQHLLVPGASPAGSEPGHSPCKGSPIPHMASPAMSEYEEHNKHDTTIFNWIWVGMSMVWFASGLAFRLSAVKDDVWQALPKAVATAAACPLAWHMSLATVVLTSTVQKLFTGHHKAIDVSHKEIGWASAFWALVHGLGELANKPANLAFSKNQIYTVGLIAFAIFALHVAFAALHRMPWFEEIWFHRIHRFTAVAVICVATAHWWPFAIFFVPPAAAFAVDAAVEFSWHAYTKKPPTAYHLGWALSSAMLAASLAIAFAWFVRAISAAPPLGPWAPFVFPPISLFLSWLAAYAGACASFGRTLAAQQETPLGYQLLN